MSSRVGLRAVAVLGGILVVVVLAVLVSLVVQHPSRDGPVEVRRPAASTGTSTGQSTGQSTGRSTGASTGTAGTPAAVTAVPSALRVLHRWDARRARAYALGSVADLRSLYAAGSGAGRADVAVLEQYRRRGLRVVGLRSQLLTVRVVEHSPGRLRLRVVDRVVGAIAQRHGHRARLPRGRPTERLLTLTRAAGAAWRVAEVGPG